MGCSGVGLEGFGGHLKIKCLKYFICFKWFKWLGKVGCRGFGLEGFGGPFKIKLRHLEMFTCVKWLGKVVCSGV